MNGWIDDPQEHIRWLNAEMARAQAEDEHVRKRATEDKREDSPGKLKRTNLFAVRDRLGFSQTRLAREAGTTRQTILAIENGRREPSVYLAVSIANVLNVSVEEIFGLQEIRTDSDKDRWAVVR